MLEFFYLIVREDTGGHQCSNRMGTRARGASSYQAFSLIRGAAAHSQDPSGVSRVAQPVIGSEQVSRLANCFVQDDNLVSLK